MKSGDIYYCHEQVWSDEEILEFSPNPDEIFRHIYIKLMEHKVGGENTCDGDAWACFGSEKLEDLKDITHETNVSYCTKHIRENFRRVYEI